MPQIVKIKYFLLTKLLFYIEFEWCFTPLSTIFQSYHSVNSHYSCLSWVSPVLSWGSKVSCPRTLQRNTLSFHCGSNLESLDYESNTLPPSSTPFQSYGQYSSFLQADKWVKNYLLQSYR